MTEDRMKPLESLRDVQPGDIALGPIHGAVGALVGLGQLALGEGFSVGALKIRHARIVTRASHRVPVAQAPMGELFQYDGATAMTRPLAVEAMPSGARHVRLMMDNAWTTEWAYFRLAEDYPGQAEDAAAVAEAMIGTPYSFGSYAALAAWRFGLRTERLERWINRRRPLHYISGPDFSGENREVALPCEAICSVLVDQAWSLAGKRVMQGVAHQAVTPGALARRLLEMVSREEAVLTLPS